MKVLLTRPLEDAISAANYLKDFSVESSIAPLLKINKVNHKKVDGEKYDFFYLQVRMERETLIFKPRI